jgi:CheY-like chemotaxis protein
MENLPTILVAEDDADDVELIQRAVDKARLRNPLQIVRDGEAAIEYLSGEGRYSDRTQHPLPFLLLLDLHMPKVSGFDVLHWLQDHPEFNSMKVAVLTASAERRDYARAMELGAHSYFVKPGSLDEFVHLMLRIRGHWALLDGHESSPQPAKLTGVA